MAETLKLAAALSRISNRMLIPTIVLRTFMISQSPIATDVGLFRKVLTEFLLHLRLLLLRTPSKFGNISPEPCHEFRSTLMAKYV